MSTKQNPGKFDCYENALPDEPYFVLLARDPQAPKLIEAWARDRRSRVMNREAPESDSAMVAEAEDCARQMRQWREANQGRWRLPSRFEYLVWLGKAERPVKVEIASPNPIMAAWHAVAIDDKPRKTPFRIEVVDKDSDTTKYEFGFYGDNRPYMTETPV